MIENTTKRDPELHWLGMLDQGQTGYIEDMEAAGQRQVVAHAELMPADGPWDELVKLGFGKPQPTDDPLFVRSSLPAGWSKMATDHSMHSNVADERGVERVGVFYKAAFYDRRADCQLINVGGNLATNGIYGDQPAALPATWAVLTDAERADYLASINRYLKDAQEHPDIYGKRLARVLALKDAAKAAR